MHEPDFSGKDFAQILEALFSGSKIQLLAFSHQRAHPIDPGAAFHGAAQPCDHFVKPFMRYNARINRLSARRFFIENGDIEITEIAKHQCARNGGGSHHQQIDGIAFFCQRQALMHAKTMLLIHHRDCQIMKHNLILKQGMRANHDLRFTRRQTS